MSEFLTIDETLIPEGGETREPLSAGAYNATCIGMVTGTGTKYQSTATEQKVRLIFAVKEDDNIHFLRTNWMKLSLHDGQPQPSALWLVLAAWTNQKSAKDLIAKMGKFDLTYFLGKPIQVGVQVNEKYNNIDNFYAPKKGQATVTVDEIPEFLVSGDKKVTDNIKYVVVNGITIKPKKDKGTSTPTTKTSAKVVTKAPVEDPDISGELPF